MKIINSGVEIISPVNYTEALSIIEKCGRVCYKSENKISEGSAENFVRGIIIRGHEAVLEHYNITVKFTNDRGVSHEEVRHRIASYAQESTRYCNYSQYKFDRSVTYIDLLPGIMLDTKMKTLDSSAISAILDEWCAACKEAEAHYFKMLELGATPQIARSVLNNSTKTELCVTMNMREWRHFFKLRADKAAHPQMREVACQLLKIFKESYPVFFEDIHVD